VEPRFVEVTFLRYKGLAWKYVDLVRIGTIAFRDRRPVSIARLSGTGTLARQELLRELAALRHRRSLLDNCIVIVSVLYF
jgi:hypothetical protein